MYDDMRDARNIFKSKNKWCQYQQKQIKMSCVSLFDNNLPQFWKLTRTMNWKSGLPVSINSINDHTVIANLFSEHFEATPY